MNRKKCNTGKNNPNYIDGRCSKIYYCGAFGCSNKITYHCFKCGLGFCRFCRPGGMLGKHHTKEAKNKMQKSSQHLSGKDNANYIDGRNSKQYYCKECNRKICKRTALWGTEKCKSCANMGRNNPRFGKLSSHSKGSRYNNIYMRSNWEVKYAKYLDKLGIKWQYEPKAFDLGNTTYTPDFYLPNQNKYIEIKGWWMLPAKKKFNLFKEIYSNINIEVLMKPDLQVLGVL